MTRSKTTEEPKPEWRDTPMVDPKRIAKGMWWQRALTLTKGCTPVTEGCRNCWSASQSHIRSKQAKPPPCYVGVTDDSGKWTGHVEALPAALDIPLHVRKPTTWAVWNDLFHADISDEFIASAFGVMAACPHHTFLVLTKRPERMREWFGSVALSAGNERVSMVDHVGRFRPWPLPNIWLGTSASTQEDLDRVVPDLLVTPAAVRFLSLEPLLGELDIGLTTATCHCCTPRKFQSRWLESRREIRGDFPFSETSARPGVYLASSNRHGALAVQTPNGLLGIKPGEAKALPPPGWVIVGCESGPKRRPSPPEWTHSIIEQCQAAGVPVFVKQLDIDGRVSKDMSAWPEWARVRQFPEVK